MEMRFEPLAPPQPSSVARDSEITPQPQAIRQTGFSSVGRKIQSSLPLLLLFLSLGCVIYSVDWKFILNLDFSKIWFYRWPLLGSAAITVIYTILCTTAGFVIGIALAISYCATARQWLKRGIAGYVEICRNTPLLVQLFWIHFALPAITQVETSIWVSALIGLSLNTSAYCCEVTRAGIASINQGQWEAAAALGLRRTQTWLLVILPLALRTVVAPATNIVINVLKGTSITSILGVGELMHMTNSLSSNTFRLVEFYTATAVIYVVLGLAISAVSRRLESKFSEGQNYEL